MENFLSTCLFCHRHRPDCQCDGFAYIQSLRAFCRAEVIIDAVLFESCVGGVAVAMTVASFCNFEFWFLWCVVLRALVGGFWRPLWILRASLGVFWGSFGGPLSDFLGSLDVLLGAVGCLEVPLGVPGGSWDVPRRLGIDFRDFPGNSGRPFGSILRSFLVFFRSLCGLLFERFLK